MKKEVYVSLLLLPFVAAFISLYNPAIIQWNIQWVIGSAVYIVLLRVMRYRYLGLSWKQSFGVYLLGPLHKQYPKVWREDLLIGVVLLALIILFLLTLI